ncbi:MAG: ABC transporter permease [Thermoanaerobaculia bacterium]|nr:ABC transporter permease [Thermoanaerobaculia bacterium]
MIRALVTRLTAALLACWIVLTAVFFLLRLLPGEPGAVFEDPRVPQEHRARLRAVYGLDRTLPEQYLRWIGGVARGEWGYSLSQHRPVGQILRESAPKTLLLSSAALVLELGLGLALGVAAASRAGTFADRAMRVLSITLWSLPTFWFGLMLLAAFAVAWPLFPPGAMRSVDADGFGLGRRAVDLLWHLALPAAAIGLPAAAATARFVRSTVLERLAEPFVQSARARGLSPHRVLWSHALRAGLAPLAQLAGLSLAALLSGTIAVEVVFAWPGIGRTTFDALVARDYPLLLAGTALSAAFVLAGSFLAEALQAWLDPRLRDA